MSSSNYEGQYQRLGLPTQSTDISNTNHASASTQYINEGSRNAWVQEPLLGQETEKVTSVGEAITRLKGNMRYQKVYVFFLIMVFICGNRFLTMYPFLQLYPTLNCFNPETKVYYECNQEEACSDSQVHNFVVDPLGPITLRNWMTELNLICLPRYEIGLMGMLLFAGQTVGSIFLTHWADIIGRKKTMIFHGAMYAIVVYISTFAQSITQVYALIFTIGLFFVPRSSCIFTYIMEITPDKYHEDATLFVYIGDGLTFVLSGIFVKYTRDPFAFLGILSATTVLSVIILAIMLPESPKFLYSKGMYDELLQCFEQIKKTNKVQADVSCQQLVEDLKEVKNQTKAYKSSFFSDLKILFDSPEHRNILIAVLGIWVYASFNYYIINYYVKYFPGDIFTNFLMMTIAEVIAPLALRSIQGKYVTKYVARYLLYAVAATSIMFMINQYYGSVALVPFIILLIRVFVKSLYSLGYYANGKLFPTLVKTSIFSLTNGIGRPFSALSTMVTEYTHNPAAIFLVSAVAFLFVPYLLPESDNTEQELGRIKENSRKQREGKPVQKIVDEQ